MSPAAQASDWDACEEERPAGRNGTNRDWRGCGGRPAADLDAVLGGAWLAIAEAGAMTPTDEATFIALGAQGYSAAGAADRAHRRF